MSQRTRRTRAEWQALIQQQRDAGQSIAAFCRSQGLTTSAFHNWKAKLNTAPNNFTRVSVAAPKSSGKIQCLLPNGIRLEWDEAVSQNRVVALLKALS